MVLLLCGCISNDNAPTTTVVKEITTTTTIGSKTTTTQLQDPSETQNQPLQTPTSLSSPTCFDNIKNQGEKDIDCGGPCKLCGLIINTPLEDTVGDNWIYFAVDNDNVTALEDKNWSYRYNYTGKTKVNGLEYDEYRVDWMEINETPYKVKWGSPAFDNSHIENNSHYVDREIYSYGSGSNTVFKYTPGYESLRYPLTVGTKWSGRSEKTWIQMSIAIITLPIDYSSEVIGQERVTVHAGTFDTLVIRDVVETRRNGKLALRETSTSWFSPKIYSSVKSEYYQEVIGTSKKYRVQTNMGDWYFEEMNISTELWNYSIKQEH